MESVVQLDIFYLPPLMDVVGFGVAWMGDLGAKVAGYYAEDGRVFLIKEVVAFEAVGGC